MFRKTILGLAAGAALVTARSPRPPLRPATARLRRHVYYAPSRTQPISVRSFRTGRYYASCMALGSDPLRLREAGSVRSRRPRWRRLKTRLRRGSPGFGLANPGLSLLGPATLIGAEPLNPSDHPRDTTEHRMRSSIQLKQRMKCFA